MMNIFIDERILDNETNGDRLRSAIHKAQVEQARLEGSAEQRAALEESNYLRGYNQCAADMLGVMMSFLKGDRS